MPGSICNVDDIDCPPSILVNNLQSTPTSKDQLMKRERTNLLRDATDKRRTMIIKCRALCRTPWCNLKPETNLALMLCLVFYLYVCLGGALFLVFEGQAEAPERPQKDIRELLSRINVKFNDKNIASVTRYCDKKMSVERRKKPINENLWSFLEATDFAYQVVTGQGTTQTTRTLYTTGGKISYILFLFFGVPLAVLTLRATGQRLNILAYATIRFINMKIFKRQLTAHIHIKALLFNICIFLILLVVGTVLYSFTQNWSLLDSVFYMISVVFTVSNSEEKIVNKDLPMNSLKDKMYRIVFNLYSFVIYTMLSSVTWSAHHFTRHMRFKAQNRQTKNGDVHSTCPWVEVTRGKPASPSKSTRERETDRESVC